MLIQWWLVVDIYTELQMINLKKTQDVEVLKMCLYVSDILVSSQGSS